MAVSTGASIGRAVTRAPARALAISLAVTGLLYVVPYGRTIAWPLVLVSTLAHELGHGFAAAALGGRFDSLRMFPDASGVAHWSGAFGRLATATVAGAGLVGPALAAFVLLALGRRASRARIVLAALGAMLLGVALLLSGNAFAFGFIALLGAACLFVAVRAPRAAQTVLVLLAVQLALSVYSRSDYLFTPFALTSSGPMPSDVSVMASALLLPYWFWGALCGGLSLLFLWLGARKFFNP
jgi:Peptidase M50B-like